ncbi:myb-like protein W isoform X2 [Glossina fuscipes]|uniref:Myb-like protein W isoform X2 n=1 Tax=Glossina fuscipes TaxID=7396 RepID=A0A9C5Z0C8_9MUSC|nr:myb-like protein W isoform X2 [Glossina fuscipes]
MNMAKVKRKLWQNENISEDSTDNKKQKRKKGEKKKTKEKVKAKIFKKPRMHFKWKRTNMENFQKIICIWLCCVYCMFGRTQLMTAPTVAAAAAVPYEYFDDHDSLLYDLDSEQIQAKYDTRLLSEQLLKTERQHKHHHKKRFNIDADVMSDGDDDSRMVEFNQQHDDAIIDMNAKANVPQVNALKQLKSSTLAGKSSTRQTSNMENDNTNDDDDNDDNDDDDDDERLGDVADVGIDDKNNNDNDNDDDGNDDDDNDDLEPHERAASCYTGGERYTHGQKVPRSDSCEVCLCMDGEIFCWWEKCDKKRIKSAIVSTDYMPTPYGDTSTIATFGIKGGKDSKEHELSTAKTIIKPVKKPIMSNHLKYDNDDLTEIIEMKQELNKAYKNQLIKQEKMHVKQEPKMKHNHDSQSHTQLKPIIKNKKTESMQHQEQQQEQQQQQQQEQEQQQPEHWKSFMNKHDRHSPGSSKILNFPENLPSVLYYDYKTEEHQHHQHLHHQQHIKHQQLLKQKKQQQKQLIQQQNEQHLSHISRLDAFNQNIFPTYKNIQQQVKTTTANANVNGYENAYSEIATEIDSDILPEPPMKKAKFYKTTPATAAAAAAATTSQNYSSSFPYDKQDEQKMDDTLTLTALNEQKTQPQSTGSLDFNRIKINSNKDSMHETVSRDELHDDVVDVEDEQLNDSINGRNDAEDGDSNDSMNDEDDAFHRWLTSTETYAKYNRNYDNIDMGIVTNSNKVATTTTKTLITTSDTSLPLRTVSNVATALKTAQDRNNEIRNATNNHRANTDNSNNNNNNNFTPYSNPYNMVMDFNDIIDRENSGVDEDSSGAENDAVDMSNIDITLTTATMLENNERLQTQWQGQSQTPLQSLEKQITPTTKHLFSQQSHLIVNMNANNSNCSNSGNTLLTAALNQVNISTALTKNRTAAGYVDSASNRNKNTYSTHALIATNFTLPALPDSTTPQMASTAAITTTLNPERQCNVMGTLYKIGDILPQDTGNCLQCICIDGSTTDDTPRVTCSPHNCPPLVLPDLFDATGY